MEPTVEERLATNAAEHASIRADLTEVKADVKDIHDLFVKNGFISKVASNRTMIRILWAGLIALGGGLAWIFKSHYTP